MSDKMMIDGVPRRIRVDLATPAERAIRGALEAVEAAGAHPRLTDAVVALGAALDATADGVEALGATAPAAAPRVEKFDRADAEPMMQFFVYAHLPSHLKAISRPFSVLAEAVVDELPRNPERTVALRKLLEAKDCAVRALLYKDAARA